MNFLKSLIGGQFVKGYSVSGDPIQGLGHHKMWKVYKGKKDSSGVQVSVFVLEKKSIKSSNKQQLLKSIKKQVSSLVKIRHPGVLSIIEPLTQDQNNLSFVSERIQGSLSSLLKQKRLFEEFLGSELQMKLNLFPLLETITFLHDIVKLEHLGINMDSVYITHDHKWKLAGMNYSQQLTGEQYQTIGGDVHFYDYLHLAPEVVKQGKFNKFADSYSLGILIINFMLIIKKTQHNLMQATQTKDSYSKNSTEYMWYNQFPCVLQSTSPQQLIQLLSQLFLQQSSYRLPISSLQSSKWINDPIVLTVKYLQKISNYQNKQQVQFLKGFAGIISKFNQQNNKRIFNTRILPILINLLKFNHLIPSIIYIVIDIIKKGMVTVEQFRKSIWVEIKPITQGKEMTAQTLYLLILNMQILQKFILEDDFMSCIIPLYLKCFDCPPKLKILALKHVQRLTKKYDYQFTKTKIIPKLVTIMKDQKIEIRKDSLKVLFMIINRIDPLTIVNVVLGGLENCRKAGSDGFINAISVEIYNKMTGFISGEVLATKIIPNIMLYLIDPTIQQQEFALYKNSLLKMMNKIQEQRKKTWSQNNQPTGNNVFYGEKDFVLEKIQQDKGTTSHGGESLNQGNRFDFLAQYQQMATSGNPTTKSNPPSSTNPPLNPNQKPITTTTNAPYSLQIDINSMSGFSITPNSNSNPNINMGMMNNTVIPNNNANNFNLNNNVLNSNSSNNNNDFSLNFFSTGNELSTDPSTLINSNSMKKPIPQQQKPINQQQKHSSSLQSTTLTNNKTSLNSMANPTTNVQKKPQQPSTLMFDFIPQTSPSTSQSLAAQFDFKPIQVKPQLIKNFSLKQYPLNYKDIKNISLSSQNEESSKASNNSKHVNTTTKNNQSKNPIVQKYHNNFIQKNYDQLDFEGIKPDQIKIENTRKQMISNKGTKNRQQEQKNSTFDDQWAMGNQQQETTQPEFNDYFNSNNESGLGSPKQSQYQPPVFDFVSSYQQNDGNKNSLSQNNRQKKQLPISPSTQPSSTGYQHNSNFGFSGDNDNSIMQAAQKKLLGPSGAKGGLKKPPKFNQFNMHLKGNEQITPNTQINSFSSANTNNKNTMNLQQSFLSNKGQNSTLGFLNSSNQQQQSDPFSQLNQSSFNFDGNTTGLSINPLNPSQKKNNTNSDPFSDLW